MGVISPLILLDTNVVLYLLGGRLAEPLPAASYLISVITEIELLSYPLLRSEDEKVLRAFIAGVRVVGLDEAIKERAIVLRKRHRLRLPDAIIAATAQSLNAELLSNDKRLGTLPDLQFRSLRLHPQ